MRRIEEVNTAYRLSESKQLVKPKIYKSTRNFAKNVRENLIPLTLLGQGGGNIAPLGFVLF